LLISYYDIKNGIFHYLCPPIPGRADYIHYIADLLAESNNGIIPKVMGFKAWILVLALIYLSNNWKCRIRLEFRRNRYRRKAIENCSTIIEANPKLVDFISLQQQTGLVLFFKISLHEDKFAFTICNPPFHKSQEEATKGSLKS
jgi:23S rRNA (adenine1618-N6)-methyltransferase